MKQSSRQRQEQVKGEASEGRVTPQARVACLLPSLRRRPPSITRTLNPSSHSLESDAASFLLEKSKSEDLVREKNKSGGFPRSKRLSLFAGRMSPPLVRLQVLSSGDRQAAMLAALS